MEKRFIYKNSVKASKPAVTYFTIFHFRSLGSCLHHQLSEERDALCVWEGEQEERADQQPGRYLQTHRERASDITWRFPQPEEDAGKQEESLESLFIDNGPKVSTLTFVVFCFGTFPGPTPSSGSQQIPAAEAQTPGGSRRHAGQ